MKTGQLCFGKWYKAKYSSMKCRHACCEDTTKMQQCLNLCNNEKEVKWEVKLILSVVMPFASFFKRL